MFNKGQGRYMGGSEGRESLGLRKEHVQTVMGYGKTEGLNARRTRTVVSGMRLERPSRLF
jgi:hypothetical protein